MVLLTKEVFIKLKELINLHINLSVNEQYDSAGILRQTEHWQVFVHGLLQNAPAHNDMFQVYITCESKEDAYRIFKELAKQVIDSGEVSEFQSRLFDEVLTEEKDI